MLGSAAMAVLVLSDGSLLLFDHLRVCLYFSLGINIYVTCILHACMSVPRLLSADAGNGAGQGVDH